MKTSQLLVEKLLSVIRILLGFIFFWAGIDKVFGLGFSTVSSKAWIQGGSPTSGFLQHADGIFGEVFNAMAGMVVVDVLFVAGLICIGAALLLSIGRKVAGYSGALLMLLLYLSLFPLENNPLIDEHSIYLVLCLLFGNTDSGSQWSFQKKWRNLSMVKKFPILK